MSGKTLTRGDGRLCLTVLAEDNVATILDTQVEATRLADGTPCAAGLPFGHKVAIRAIAKGDEVVKYGVVIGHATADIAVGEHVHVHNLT